MWNMEKNQNIYGHPSERSMQKLIVTTDNWHKSIKINSV
jgi:hypothetical protein